MASCDKVKVAVRVRPFSRREIELGTKCVIDMDDTQTMLYNNVVGIKENSDPVPSSSSKNLPKTFAFDHCFWSISSENGAKFADQEKVFNCLGRDVLERAFEGYNACIFAYGQTGSGKSYSMMGTVEQKGIIPRLCDALFERIGRNDDPENNFKVEVSYMEIYNEKVRDLLDPKGKHNLKVREHNILGPYVDDLSTLAVSSFEDIDNLMCEGNKSRTVAATNMNSESSRSHAVFNIILTQTLTDIQSAVSGEKVSKISLVDLAGSERAQKTGAVGERLKEGSNINKSLTTLGLVISALADQSIGKNKLKFVPYRDSVLTWLLKDNLGGNSKTVMIATLSPAADNYEETLSTLRYADRAKRIVNHAVVNEDPNARIIRELREEVDMLRKMLSEAQSQKSDDLRERLEESEKLMNEMGKTWEEKLKETERIHQERHAALEKMGISVQTSGIKVEQGKYYLVNLNADPSLNELLVYYLKPKTLVGRPDASVTQDIQLSGLGIMSEHCVISIDGIDVYIVPLDEARTCVNGRTITEKTKVKHGDRIVWGNNHFFRINCPKANSPSSEVPETIDYDFAQQELMLQQMGNDPVQEAISCIEKQHEEAKQEALDKQRQMYERQMQLLRTQLMSPSTPSIPYPFDTFNKLTPGSLVPTCSTPSSLHPKYQQWARDREKFFHESLAKLKEAVVKANTLVREAKFLAQELNKQVDFSVTLQIPAANLSPNRKFPPPPEAPHHDSRYRDIKEFLMMRGAFVSEPAILVKQKDRVNQVWSMEKFENKVFEMREGYQDRKEIRTLSLKDESPPSLKRDPFDECQENHSLIGVANIFLEVLFYDAKLEYHVPIISQQGEVAGRLHIEISRVPGKPPDRSTAEDQGSEITDVHRNNNGVTSCSDDGSSTMVIGSYVTCQVVIKQARGLPPAQSNFVFCQYTFWSYPDVVVVPPLAEPSTTAASRRDQQIVFNFDHVKEFTVHVTDEFLEHCTEGALSIEVWGNRSAGFSNLSTLQQNEAQAKSRSIIDRWSELTRKIELWVQVLELNELGEYVPVEVTTKYADVPTGGVYQLRQGHSRRILVQVKPVHNSGTLPIICESINHVQIGCVTVRSKLQKGLDSYQEEDLTRLREKWSEALEKRREYLDEQLQKIMNKEVKSDEDVERERSLIDQWVCLTEERNEVLVPAAGSGVPGAPADWNQPHGMERHIPVIFLDLNAEDMSTLNTKEGMQAAVGLNSLLPKEQGAKFFTLPLVKNIEKEVSVLLAWDSSVHDSIHLNRETPSNERVYLIIKVVVQLSHPATMELVLRKRVCINVYKKRGFADRLRQMARAEFLTASGVTYEIVSNIPKASEDLEDRESLARIAASQNDQGTSDGETYIEKYIKGVSAVESILTLDRLRQDVAMKEILAARGRPLRKATSVPNIHNIMPSPSSFTDQLRSDSSQDLSFGHDASLPKHLTDSFQHRGALRTTPGDITGTPRSCKDPGQGSTPFGIGPVGSKVGASPAQTSKQIKPLTTLVEEQTKTAAMEENSRDGDSEDEFVNPNIDSSTTNKVNGTGATIPYEDHQDVHHTFHAVHVAGAEDDQGAARKQNGVHRSPPTNHRSFTPSLASSGYASQTLSSLTLSSGDSSSVHSINVDDSAVSSTAELSHCENRSHSTNSPTDDRDGGHALYESSDSSSQETIMACINITETRVENNTQPVSRTELERLNCSAERVEEVRLHTIVGNFDEVSTDKNSDIFEERSISTACLSSDESAEKTEMLRDNEGGIVKDNVVNPSGELNGGGQNIEPVDIADNCSVARYSENTMDISRSSVNVTVPDKELQQLDVSHIANGSSYAAENISVQISAGDKTTDAVSQLSDNQQVDHSSSGATDKPSIGVNTVPPGVSAESGSIVGNQLGKGQEDVVADTSITGASDGASDDLSSSFGSHADLQRLYDSPLPAWIQVGEPVIVLFSHGCSKTGLIQFVGQTEFASGNWVGVELETSDGKNDGSVRGIRYFRCRPHHGVFVRHDKLVHDKKRSKQLKAQAKMSNSMRRSTGNLSAATPANPVSSSREGAASNLSATSSLVGSSFMKPTSASSAKHK